MFKKLINIKAILIIALTSSCGLSIPGTKTHKREMKAIYDMTSSMKHNNNQGQDPYDVNDLRGCFVPFEIDKWEEENVRNKIIHSRSEEWISPNRMITSTGDAIDYPYTSQQIHDRVTKEDYSYIYIGPWKYSKTIGKKIRFVAHQKSDFTRIIYTFVSYNDFASKIKEKPFALKKDYALPTLDSLCKVKWFAKFGYSTIAETHHPGLLDKMLKIPVPTGKLIAKE